MGGYGKMALLAPMVYANVDSGWHGHGLCVGGSVGDKLLVPCSCVIVIDMGSLVGRFPWSPLSHGKTLFNAPAMWWTTTLSPYLGKNRKKIWWSSWENWYDNANTMGRNNFTTLTLIITMGCSCLESNPGPVCSGGILSLTQWCIATFVVRILMSEGTGCSLLL